jgi:hypothetical protein
MKEGVGNDNLAIAWQYPGRALEVIPASFSLVKLTCDKDPSCGATLYTWTNISDNQSTRLIDLLEGSGSRIKGWLLPPVTGNYSFWIAASENGGFWLSTDSDPAKKVLVCQTPGPVSYHNFTAYSEQKSNPISLVSGRANFFEVRVCVMLNPSNA